MNTVAKKKEETTPKIKKKKKEIAVGVAKKLKKTKSQ